MSNIKFALPKSDDETKPPQKQAESTPATDAKASEKGAPSSPTAAAPSTAVPPTGSSNPPPPVCDPSAPFCSIAPSTSDTEPTATSVSTTIRLTTSSAPASRAPSVESAAFAPRTAVPAVKPPSIESGSFVPLSSIPADKPLLGYWNIRGLAEPVRYILRYKGVDFEDRRYNFGPPPAYDFSEWADNKAALNLSFPGLPYYIEGDVKLTQSLAIMRYLARKHGLDAANEVQKRELDLMEQQVCELRWGLGRVIFSLDFDLSQKKYMALLPQTLEPYAKYFTDKKWVLGERISYVDFMMYETLDWIRIFSENGFRDMAPLIAYCDRFETLPTIRGYRSSNGFVNWPIFGPLAKWGFRKKNREEIRFTK
ncbi:glutathione S-transferase 2-like [Ornithodoros turicata]|uniref:glutathione S-transferase 2-like n=1 Tax=Ornithodoros turicata TaxID=34597 RepID=UPI00313942EE